MNSTSRNEIAKQLATGDPRHLPRVAHISEPPFVANAELPDLPASARTSRKAIEAIDIGVLRAVITERVHVKIAGQDDRLEYATYAVDYFSGLGGMIERTASLERARYSVDRYLERRLHSIPRPLRMATAADERMHYVERGGDDSTLCGLAIGTLFGWEIRGMVACRECHGEVAGSGLATPL